AHMVFPEIISKEPLGPLVRQGDDEWADVVRWTLNVMINAEEYGVSSANVDDLKGGSDNPEINRMLGSEGNLNEMIGLDKDWAYNIIKQVGNYGEVFERFLGVNTPIGLERGLNALYTDGGLLYAPPMR
ncbi:MAG: amino acid ABC transporter substrate-binding protein, partial [Alphaproteobacteria bacterium]